MAQSANGYCLYDNNPVKSKDLAIFILLSALWGGSYLFMRLCVGILQPLAIVECRLVIAATFMGCLLLLVPKWRSYLRLQAQAWKKLVFIALFNSVIPFLVIAYAIQFINAGTGSVLNATSPIWTAMIGAFWFGEKLTPSRIAGLVIGFLGIVFLMWGKAGFGGDGVGLAVVAAMVGTLSYGICSNYLKRYASDLPPLTITFWSTFIAAILLLYPASFAIPVNDLPIKALVGIVGLGIFSTAIAYMLFFRLAESAGATVAITVTFLVPVFSMLWGEIFLGEEVTLRMLLGALIVLSGTALAIGLITLGKPQTEVKLPMD